MNNGEITQKVILLETCPNCYKPLREGWKFCPNCEIKLEVVFCKQCKTEIKKTWDFCPHCKTSTKEEEISKTFIHANDWLKDMLEK